MTVGPNREATLYLGDSLEVLPTLQANSVDSIVTDPPYGLSFMGSNWDHGVPGEPFWREALRVAKPGAHLLAFGGTRTFHRLAVAIEDAGWEIRDTVMWVYAQGFPKSMNVGKRFCNCGKEKGTKQDTEYDVHSLREGNLPQAKLDEKESRDILQQGVSEQSTPAAEWEQFRPTENRKSKPFMEGRRNSVQEERELHRRNLCEGADVGAGDGAKGRIHNGAPIDNGADGRAIIEQDGGSSPYRPQPKQQPAGKSSAMAGQQQSQKVRVGEVCNVCGKQIGPEWADGWGTALKPAWEPIIVARKPVEGTVAGNVLKYGTGGLNIDSCRISVDPSVDDPRLGGKGTWGTSKMAKKVYEGGYTGKTIGSSTEGRFPANLIHDGSDEVLRLFPVTNSKYRMTQHGSGTNTKYGEYARTDKSFTNDGVSGTGNAARFFYCAKASKRDRDEGLPDGEHSSHPTVKPTDLMRYLCRFVTPPGGIVLDPFMGSGSTGKAAVLEGLQFTGIDLSDEYIDVARGRIEHAFNDGGK